MSQSRVRKAPSGSETNKSRASVLKASGDNAPFDRPKEQNRRSKSKNKLPKSIRYDLENALVSLCDVWFEDIKPYLVRNNIKLHIDGSGVGPDYGDHSCLPAGAPGCSHVDPGAASDLQQPTSVSFVDCSATRQTASRAPCRRPARPPPPGRPPRPPSSPPTRPSTRDWMVQNKPKIQLSHCSNRTEKPSKKSNWNWRSPRHCRTRSVLTATSSTGTVVKSFNSLLLASTEPPHEDNCIPVSKAHPTTKTALNAWCQTDPVPTLCFQNYANRQPVPKINRFDTKDSKLTITEMQQHLASIIQQGCNEQSKLVAVIQKHIHTTVPQKKLVPKIKKSEPQTIPLNPYSQPSPSQDYCYYKDISSQNKPISSETWCISLKNKGDSPHTDPIQQNKPQQSKTTSVTQRNRVNSHLSRATVPQNRSTQKWPNSPKSKSPTSHNDKIHPDDKRMYSKNRLKRPSRQQAAAMPSRVKPFNQMPIDPEPMSPQVGDISSQFGSTLRARNCERCPATTSIHPRKHNKNKQDRLSQSLNRDKRQKERVDNGNRETPTLFDNELIDIIAEKNDKNLKMLFQSIGRNPSASSTVMNLCSSPSEKLTTTSCAKKSKPWR